MIKGRGLKRHWEYSPGIKESNFDWFLYSGCKIFTEWVAHVPKFEYYNSLPGFEQILV